LVSTPLCFPRPGIVAATNLITRIDELVDLYPKVVERTHKLLQELPVCLRPLVHAPEAGGRPRGDVLYVRR
jgi:hypothetical protein